MHTQIRNAYIHISTDRPNGTAARKLLLVFTNMHVPCARCRFPVRPLTAVAPHRENAFWAGPREPFKSFAHNSVGDWKLLLFIRRSYPARARLFRQAMFMLMTLKQNCMKFYLHKDRHFKTHRISARPNVLNVISWLFLKFSPCARVSMYILRRPRLENVPRTAVDWIVLGKRYVFEKFAEWVTNKTTWPEFMINT